MTILLNIGAFLFAFAAMEGVAWFTHKYIMHGLLWTWHKDHHRKDHYGWYEWNDLFFLFFAIPGIVLILSGFGPMDYRFFLGLGITAYGATYFIVHDLFIHQRFRVLRKTDNRYFKAIRRAHKIHHKRLHRTGGECFGMLLAPGKYLKEVQNADQ